ncbi:MAG: hypothetical protein LBN11_03550 [Tannerella sp.]|jgi:hypothetical protein|nr:hypothetical protein [Tannerella sp.]
MTKYFLISSLFVIALSGCSTASKVGRTAGQTPSDARVWTAELRSDDEKNSYQVNIHVKEKPLSGICLLKKNDDGWRGTLINEFGSKAFDFVVAGRKCELKNTISLMDKWYIRKTIAADLYYLFEIDNPAASFQKKTVRYEQDGAVIVSYGKKKTITRLPDSSLELRNHQRNILYSLKKLEE